jgi:transcriptional regulator with XRE-family HTH domain
MDFMKFKEILQRFRERRGFNKSEVAIRIDVTPTYYMELESGRRGAPTKEKLEKLSDVFELSPSEKQLFIDTAMEERLSSDAFEWLAGKEKIQQIPIISWVAANKWSESVDVFPVGSSVRPLRHLSISSRLLEQCFLSSWKYPKLIFCVGL